MPGAGAAAADRQHPDPGLQLADQLGERQRAQPHGGELDRERDAVEPLAQPHDVRPVLRRDGEPGDYRRRALGEQVRRVILGGQREQREGMLPLGVERLPAGGQQGHPGRGAQHGVGEGGAGVDQVLARVEDEQQPLAAQVAEEGRARRRLVLVRQAERGGDGGREQVGIADPGQVGEPDAVGNWSAATAAARRLSRVFPTPAGPTTVTMRAVPSSAVIPASSTVRPTKLVASAGSRPSRRGPVTWPRLTTRTMVTSRVIGMPPP